MVVIRLARGGAKNRPFYNIVVTDCVTVAMAASIERVGFYNPVAAKAPRRIRLNSDRLAYWTRRRCPGERRCGQTAEAAGCLSRFARFRFCSNKRTH